MNCHRPDSGRDGSPQPSCHRGRDLSPQRSDCATTAMTLIEMIGVLAILAVMAAMIFPAAIRILDRMASDKEVAALSSLGDALKTGILRTRKIPAATNWVSFIASEAGIDTTSVSQNPRKRQRAFLFNDSGWFA